MIIYKQITLEEREKIYKCLNSGMAITKIAKELARNKSSISREIKRNKSNAIGYLPDRANILAIKRKNRNISKIEKHQDLKQYIVNRLKDDRWSPGMIAGRMKIEHKETKISHETIYQYIYSRNGQKLGLYGYLMYKRKEKRLKFSRKKRFVPEELKIQNRPKEIQGRSEFGHFEGDLTFFKGSRRGNFSAIVERKSRKVFLIKNETKKSINVMLGLKHAICKSISCGLVKSITFDNGGEFKQFGILKMLGIKTYFCDPGCPYQKGQVERTNAILHKFIPKNSNFNELMQEDVLIAQERLNNLPRKCLNYLTPNEAWNIYEEVALHS